jgi:hypothetical protein
LMVLDRSRIEANAPQGRGGDITIRAGQLIRTPDSLIRATGHVAGNITIAAPSTDVAGSLVVLPETFFDASSQLREACAARSGHLGSSLTAGGARRSAAGSRRTAGRQSIRAVAGAADRHRIADGIDAATAASAQTDHDGRNSTTDPRFPTPLLSGIAGWCHQQDLFDKSAPSLSSHHDRTSTTPEPRKSDVRFPTSQKRPISYGVVVVSSIPFEAPKGDNSYEFDQTG